MNKIFIVIKKIEKNIGMKKKMYVIKMHKNNSHLTKQFFLAKLVFFIFKKNMTTNFVHLFLFISIFFITNKVVTGPPWLMNSKSGNPLLVDEI